MGIVFLFRKYSFFLNKKCTGFIWSSWVSVAERVYGSNFLCLIWFRCSSFPGKEGLNITIPKIVFLIQTIRNFWGLASFNCAVKNIEQRLCFLLKQPGIGLWSFEAVFKGAEPETFCSFIVNENTIPITSREVVQSFCSLVATRRELYEKTSIFPLLLIWNRTQALSIKKQATVKTGWFLLGKVIVTSFVIFVLIRRNNASNSIFLLDWILSWS